MITTFQAELEAFMADHAGHDASFEDQEFIVCLDCDETFELPEGSGVNQVNAFTVIIEVFEPAPGCGVARFTIDPMTGRVTV